MCAGNVIVNNTAIRIIDNIMFVMLSLPHNNIGDYS